jgi:hypothetical protein
VGLETHTALVVLDSGQSVVLPEIDLIALLRLEDVVRELAHSGYLPFGQAEQMRLWLNASRRPRG